jgi:hypothetical protein
LRVEEAKERLKDYLLDGIAREIFRADEAYSLAVEIGNNADQINAANFGEFFGSLQIILSDRQTLSAVKIFDPIKKYPTRSIPGTLSLLEDNADLWEIPGQQELHQTLVEAGSEVALVEGLDNVQLTHAIVAYFRDTLPSSEQVDPHKLSVSLSALRQFRDKTIAHNEDIEAVALPKATWGDATSLVSYAKKFVAIVGIGYLNLNFGGRFGQDESDDDYALTSDARRASVNLQRLFKTAGITETESS